MKRELPHSKSIPTVSELKQSQSRVFSFQPTDEARLLITLAEEILGEDRTQIINEACLNDIPARIEARASAHANRINALLTDFRNLMKSPAFKSPTPK